MTKNSVVDVAAAAHNEASTSKTLRQLVFNAGEPDEIVIELPRKYKRFKFLRAIAREDLLGALEAIWPPTKVRLNPGDDVTEIPHPTLEQLMELDVSDEDFEKALEDIATSLGGISMGNSEGSPS